MLGNLLLHENETSTRLKRLKHQYLVIQSQGNTEEEENDYNCNIRRYADNAPPPKPQDVRAHLLGGIPKAEMEAKRSLLEAHGFNPTRILVERN